MRGRSDELDDFKTRINLTAYAASCGYELDRRGSSRNSPMMVHPNGDKIVIGRRRHWTYFSVRDPKDSGTIIDFVQNRTGDNLGKIRQELRSWLGEMSLHLESLGPARYVARVEPTSPDLLLVRARYEAMQPIGESPSYLQQERNIPGKLLQHPALREQIRIDERGNTIFPHYNAEGELSGYEIKNSRFTGFAKGGMKGLWFSRPAPDDRRLVIAETAIDAISYAALHGFQELRLLSIAGQMSPLQRKLLGSAMKKMPHGAIVVIGTDNDAAGDSLTADIRAIHQHVGREDLGLQEDRPEKRDSDWNDILRAGASPSTGLQLPTPSERFTKPGKDHKR